MKAELKIVSIYVLVGVLWIWLSDQVLLFLFQEHELEQVAYLQTMKGVFYVLFTATLLYLLVKKYYEKLDNKVKELEELNAMLEEKSKELEASNKDLEQFAFVISHDLQEPLRMISAFLVQLKKKYQDHLDEKAHQYIFFAVDGASRMKQIILDLLEFSRVGRYNEPLEEVDINEVMEEIFRSNHRLIEETHAKILTKEMPIITAHRQPILQLFQHLIGNALKYRSDLRDPEIELGVKDSGNVWEFWIKDNGIGINSEYAERIFVIFQRLHTTDKFGGGTGIGLALVKKIVDYYGGSVSVESQEGMGSTFYFTLPKKSALSKNRAA